MSLKVESLSDFSGVGTDEWDAMLAEGATRTVFQTRQWHEAWWQVFGHDRQLHLFVAREDARPVAALALCQGRDRTLRFVGHGRSDYLDVIGGARSEVRQALWAAAMELRDWRRIDLRYVPEDSPTLRDLEALGVATLCTETSICPALRLERPDDLASVLRKKSLRRHHAWFDRQPGAEVAHLTSAAEILPHLDGFFDQHVRRWAETSHPSLFRSQQVREFFRAATARLDGTGWLCFTRLAIAGRCVAYHFGLRFGDRLIWYKPSFEIELKKHSPGEAMIVELLHHVQREELAELDFSVGDEAFKQRFQNHIRRNATVAVFRSGLDHLRARTVHKAKQLAKTVIGRS